MGLNIESFYFGKMHLRQQVKTEKVTDPTNFTLTLIACTSSEHAIDDY